MTEQRDQRLADTFVTLTDTLVDDFDILNFLALLSERAAELLSVSAAGVILSDQRGGWHPTAGSSEEARLVELFAAQTQEGPCVDCVREGRPVASADLAAETERWPRFADAAVQAGFGAACAVPMRVRRDVIGSLTLLNVDAVGVDEASIRLGQALADMATVGILQQRAAHRGEVVVEQLQAALHHRVVVEQAKGVLAERGGLAVHHAFVLLRDYARTNNQRLTDLARSVADGTVDACDLLAHREERTSR